MNTSQQLELFGQALMDYYNGDTEAILDYCRDDGHVDSIPVGLFFICSFPTCYGDKCYSDCFFINNHLVSCIFADYEADGRSETFAEKA